MLSKLSCTEQTNGHLLNCTRVEYPVFLGTILQLCSRKCPLYSETVCTVGLVSSSTRYVMLPGGYVLPCVHTKKITLKVYKVFLGTILHTKKITLKIYKVE
jgi:hypothetical protein